MDSYALKLLRTRAAPRQTRSLAGSSGTDLQLRLSHVEGTWRPLVYGGRFLTLFSER